MPIIANKIIKDIKNKKIKPLPKWVFNSQNILFWIAVVLNTILGAFAISLVVFLFTNSDPITLNSSAEIFIFSFPLFWILLSIFLFVFGYFYYRKTDNGYKATVTNFAIKNLGIVLIIASIFWLTGISERFNAIFSDSIPYYKNYIDTRYKAWSQPQFGRLAGTIKKVYPEHNFLVLEDFDKQEWTVHYKQAGCMVRLIKGTKIKSTGKIIEEVSTNSFSADRIMPWEGKHRLP
jgi:hypothetical protein